MTTVARARAEQQEAEDYAALILDGQPHDWAAINRTIITRYSMTALRRIKEQAWRIVTEKRHG